MSGIDIKPDAQGKVRDIYDLGDKLLMVATDRISAFDYILEDEIPHKGAVLTQISLFWLEQLKDVIGNHLISADVADLPEQFKPYADYLRGRFMLVKKAEMFPVECIVRGYLAGSGLKEYQKQGTVCGIQLPEGLVNSSKLPEPIFTPSTKAEIGDHDENISFERCAEILGEDAATQLRDLAIKVYSVARDHAAENGIIIADTKFEFGVIDGQIILADEPVASLDPVTAKQVMDDFQRINRDMRITILINIHHVDLALQYATRVIGIRAGRVVYDGPAGEVDGAVLDAIYQDRKEATA